MERAYVNIIVNDNFGFNYYNFEVISNIAYNIIITNKILKSGITLELIECNMMYLCNITFDS